MENMELFTREQISENIRQRFATIRYNKGLTAQQLADKMDITVQCLNQIECGKRLPSIEVLFHFCQATNVSLKEFFDEDLKYPTQYQTLIPYLSELNQDELQDIISIIKRIVKSKK